MLTTYGSLEGSGSQHRVFLPLLVLAGLGIGLGIVISERKRVRNYYKEDLISRLSDDVLCLILSQLTTKDAVRTGILSRRWRNLYIFLPKLSLNCPCTFKNTPSNQQCTCRPRYKLGFLTVMVPFRRPQDFSTVVDRFLQLRQGIRITSFQLSSCLGREVTCHLGRWMQCIARLNIEELVLRFSCDPFVINMRGNCSIRELITFPFQLLSEASMLRSLTLCACNLEPNIQGPFRSLTSLSLNAVPLVNGGVQSILSSCPKLESLILEYCGLPGKIFIGRPELELKLESLILEYCRLPGKIFIGRPELELKFLTISSCFGVEEIDLCAGNLTSFEIVCSNSIKIRPFYVPKLQEFCCLSGDLPYITDNVPSYIPRLESLYLEFRIPKAFYLPARGYSLFNNLKQLYLLMDFDMIVEVQELKDIIHHCPLLERFHLVIKGTRKYFPAFGSCSRYVVHLKEIEFGGFRGLNNEVAFILYLLANAVSLEQMLISMDYRYYIGGRRWDKSKERLFNEKQVEVLRQLFQGKVASSTARIILR